MKQSKIANQIKSLRTRKVYSQEVLAEKTGLSLRTIQRIENGETEPRGDSLKRLAEAFEVTPDELVDWTVQEDTGFLISMNLSSLSFLIFPLLGVLIPFVIWVSKKGKIKGVDDFAKELLNFQITANILHLIGIVVIPIAYVSFINHTLEEFISFGVQPMVQASLVWWLFMGLYNTIMVLLNTYRLNRGTAVVYTPKFRFIKR